MEGYVDRIDFAAFALPGELDLNRLAQKLGIARKYRWEEPLVLNLADLTVSLRERSSVQLVYLYYFGGVVFVNAPDEAMHTFLARMAGVAEEFRPDMSLRYRDDYTLRVDESGRMDVSNDSAVMPRYEHSFLDIICFVIAKSAALERIEEKVDQVLDDMEGLISRLNRGKLSIPDRELARLASTILNFKYTSIAHVMVLDKPEITWEEPEADLLYSTMADLFELDQRYQEIRHKSETLLDITEVFSSLSHARRAARLEWVIIVLILIEIVIFVLEIFWRQT
jgi:uncharacterized Rmd1/YagE family protein